MTSLELDEAVRLFAGVFFTNDDDPDGRAAQFTGRRLLPWGGMPLIIGG
jgi:hypothetical protein